MIFRRHPSALILLRLLTVGAVLGAPFYGQDTIFEKPGLIRDGLRQKPKVELKILGVSNDMQKNIRDVLGERLGFLLVPPASRAEASDLAFILENYMRNQGFPDVEISWHVESPTLIRLRVEKGKVITIDKVVIEGVVGITDDDNQFKEELSEVVVAKTKMRDRLNDQGTPYVPEDLALGVENIRTLLHARGYWNAEVNLTATENPESGKTTIVVDIDRGKLINIGSINFEGLTASELATVNPLADSVIGKDATADRLIDFEQRIRAVFDRQGFYDTSVRFSQSIFGGNMALTVTVNPGRQVTVGNIIIKEKGRTDDDVILRRLKPYQGKLYDPDKITAAVDNLYATGVYERIEVEEFVEPDDTIDLEITLQEADASALGFYTGLSSESGAIAGISYNHLNVGGRLHQFRSILEYSSIGPRGDATYTIPWYLVDKTNASFRVFGISRDYAAYDKLAYGWEHALTYPFTDQYSASVRVGGSLVDTSNLKIDPTLAGPLDYYVSYIGFTQTYDNLDDALNPRKGLMATLQLDTAGSWIGSDVTFSRAIARGAYYLPIGESSHMKFAASSGVIHADDDETLPIDLRFFQGGTSSLRSFRDRRGPPFSDSGNPIGGNTMNYGSIEYVAPIVGPVNFVLFTDAGNVVPGTDPFNFSDLEVAVGGGIRVRLPTGPIRFEYGYNATQDEGEPEGTFQFVIGVSF